MPRPIEYNRDEVLQKAMELFWANGYKQTSVRDVLDTTGFNRHSLYEEFGGKDGLFKAALDYYKHHIAGQIINVLQDKDSDLETIKNLFYKRAEADTKGKGCLFSNAANSKQSIDKDLFNVVKNHNRKVEKAFEFCILNAQRKNQIPKHKNAKVLSRYVSTVIHGLGPMCKLGISKSEIIEIGEMTIQSLTSP